MESRAITLTIDGYTSNQYIDARIVWMSLQDNKLNTSKVTASLQYRRTNTGFNTYGTGTFSITINGKSTSVTKYLSIENDWVTAVEATVTVAHNSNGSKTVSISGAGSIPDTTLISTFVSGNVTLPTIPRASTLDYLSCTPPNFHRQITYKYTPKNESYYNRCNISLNLNGEYIAVKSINLGQKPATKQTNTVALSEDELAIIYKKLPSATEGVLRFTLRTYSDSGYSTQVGDPSHKELTLFIADSSATKPTATMTLSPVSSLAAPLNKLYIKGRTKVDANFTDGEGKYGASIVSYEMSVGGKSYGSPYTSGYLSTTGSVNITGTVTDSRGFARTYTESITVLPYEKPMLLPVSGESGVICARCDADGNLSDSGKYLKIKAKRSYSKVTSGGVQNNFCDIRYRCVPEGTKFTGDDGWVTLLAGSTTSTDTVSKTLSGVVSSTEKAYIVQVGVIDDLGETAVLQFVIPTDFITMDVPEEHKGRRIGFHRYVGAEDGTYFGLPIFGGSVDSLKLGTALTATETAPIDLNDIKTPGCYYSPGASYSQYILNSPYTTGGFGLEVRELQSDNYIRQTLYYGRTTLIRHWNTTEWSDWLRYMTVDEVSGTAVDFVSEIGVWNVDDNNTDKGYWRYRKWKSGAVDMNGLVLVNPVTEGTLGTAGVYYSEVIYLDLPFEVVNFQFTGATNSYHCFVGNCNSVEGNNKQIRLRLYRFTDFAGLADYKVYVRIVASGKLK